MSITVPNEIIVPNEILTMWNKLEAIAPGSELVFEVGADWWRGIRYRVAWSRPLTPDEKAKLRPLMRSK